MFCIYVNVNICFIADVYTQYFCFELFFILGIFSWIEMWKKASLSKIASNRLQKELVEWQVNPPTGFKHKVTDNLQRFFKKKYFFDFVYYIRDLKILLIINYFWCFRWVVEVNGAPGTLYGGETFQLQVDFPEHYPMEAPQVNFSNDLKFFSLTL